MRFRHSLNLNSTVVSKLHPFGHQVTVCHWFQSIQNIVQFYNPAKIAPNLKFLFFIILSRKIRRFSFIILLWRNSCTAHTSSHHIKLVLHQKQVLIMFSTFVPRIKESKKTGRKTKEQHNRSLSGSTSLGSAKIIKKSHYYLNRQAHDTNRKLHFSGVHQASSTCDGQNDDGWILNLLIFNNYLS